MCHTIHYTDRDKTEFCEDGRLGRKCKLTEEWVNRPRKHALSKLDLTKIEVSTSLADRLPTPYAHVARSTSPSPHRSGGDGVYINGTKVVELSKPRKHRDSRDEYYYERRSSKYESDPRDRDDDRRERRSRRDDPPSGPKRSSTLPYVIIQQEKPRRSSRDDGYDRPAVDLIKEYSSRRRRSSRERDARDPSPGRGLYYRKHTADGYVIVDDEKERRELRRERRRSLDYDAAEPVRLPRSTAELRYTPRRASTIIHRSDGTTIDTSKTSPKPKTVAWDDEVRVKREPYDLRAAQNEKIANRPKQRPGDPDRDPRLKGILKNTDSNKGKSYREEETYHDEERRRRDEIRRAVEKMGIQTSSSSRDRDRDHDRDRDRELRGRSREPQEWDEQVERLRTRLGDVKPYRDDDDRRKRSKVWLDDRYVYR